MIHRKHYSKWLWIEKEDNSRDELLDFIYDLYTDFETSGMAVVIDRELTNDPDLGLANKVLTGGC